MKSREKQVKRVLVRKQLTGNTPVSCLGSLRIAPWAAARAPLLDVFGCAKQSHIFPYAMLHYSMLTSNYMGSNVHDARQGSLRRKSTIGRGLQ